MAEQFPDPLIATASGWMNVRARPRQVGVQLPLVISDYADWPALCATARDVGAGELWVTHGETEALVHWATLKGIDAPARHHRLWRRGRRAGRGGCGMKAFAALLDRLSFEPARNAKLRLITTYLATEPDPDRG